MANDQIVEDAEIFEAMVDNEIVINMPPKRRFQIKMKIGIRGKPAFGNLEEVAYAPQTRVTDEISECEADNGLGVRVWAST